MLLTNAHGAFKVNGQHASFSTGGASAEFSTSTARARFGARRASAAMEIPKASLTASVGTVIYGGGIPSNYGLITYNGSIITVS